LRAFRNSTARLGVAAILAVGLLGVGASASEAAASAPPKCNGLYQSTSTSLGVYLVWDSWRPIIVGGRHVAWEFRNRTVVWGITTATSWGQCTP
jgi:hypothetical protein